jgi:hypothetical protein
MLRFRTDKIVNGHRVWSEDDEARPTACPTGGEIVVEHALSGMTYFVKEYEIYEIET